MPLQNASATIVFSTMFGLAIESLEPTIRNSNLLPVNANGDVLLRSVASFARSGSVLTPVSSLPPFRLCVASPVLISCANYIFQLLAKENRNNCRRCLVCSQSVIISYDLLQIHEADLRVCLLLSRYRSVPAGTVRSREVSCLALTG